MMKVVGSTVGLVSTTPLTLFYLLPLSFVSFYLSPFFLPSLAFYFILIFFCSSLSISITYMFELFECLPLSFLCTLTAQPHPLSRNTVPCRWSCKHLRPHTIPPYLSDAPVPKAGRKSARSFLWQLQEIESMHAPVLVCELSP